MTLEAYVKWLHSKGVADNDELLFVQDDGSGYATEISDAPIVKSFGEYFGGKGMRWENDPKWVLGTGTTGTT